MAGDTEQLRTFFLNPVEVIRLERRGRNNWEFVLPHLYHVLEGLFDSGCDYLERGNEETARRVFCRVIKGYPHHIDAYNHLAVLAWRKGSFERAEKLYQQAFNIGRRALPENFDGRLPWTLLYNRPFLRAVHGHALYRVQNGNVSEARRLLNRLLQFDPEDPLGAREILGNL